MTGSRKPQLDDAAAPPRLQALAGHQLTTLLNATPDGVVLIDAEGVICSFNPGAERIFGYEAQEVLGRNIAMLMPAPQRVAHDGYLQRYSETGEARMMRAPREVEAQRRSGEVFPAEVSVGEVPSDPSPYFIGIVRDMSERRVAEEQLRKVEANLLAAQTLAHVGSFEGQWPEQGDFFWSDELFRIVGLEPGDDAPTPSEFIERFVHPEDRGAVRVTLERSLEEGRAGEVEYRLVRPDGGVRHVQTIHQVVTDGRTGERRIQGSTIDLTQRREAEQALRRERDRAQRYLDLVNVMIVAVDRDGRITLVNREGCELLGYLEDELVGKDFFAACQPPGTAGRARILFEEALNGRVEEFTLIEGPVLTRSGRTRRVRWRNQFLRNDAGDIIGVLSAGEDVTEQRETEAQLRQAEEELRLIFRRAPVGMATLSAAHEINGHFLSVNQAMCSMLGYTESELLGMSMRQLTHPDDLDDVSRQLAALFSGSESVKHETRYYRKDGEIAHALVHHSLVADSHGRPLIIISQILDRTDVVQAEMEARSQRARLAHVARLGTLGEMAAGIAHELNQPLAAIANYTQACQRLLALGSIDTDELGDVLKRVTAQARRAGDVIHRLRTFVRRHTTERLPHGVNDLVEEILPLVELDTRSHEVELVLALSPDLPRVQCDGVQLQQVLLNLTRNAVEAMGPVERAKRLIIATRMQDDDELEVSVEDTGEGVPEDLIGQLFEPFFTTKPEGMGLGLSLSRSIVEAHGGALRYDSRPEGGSIFRMLLPTAPEEE
jgi:two-component system sensor kinase FixL